MSDGRESSLIPSPASTPLAMDFVCLFLANHSLTLPLPVNDARAVRVAEIMTDFRNLQHYLVQLNITPTPEEYYLEGYSLLRQCASEAQSILQAPFAGGSGGATGNPEYEKQQLRA